ncbi:hypothetical protein EJ110_NYTH43367 [Nymphaea thermarum]|nr:hypothetical protein EJ110_NYTH43367 [Nymphaea thermarum]
MGRNRQRGERQTEGVREIVERGASKEHEKKEGDGQREGADGEGRVCVGGRRRRKKRGKQAAYPRATAPSPSTSAVVAISSASFFSVLRGRVEESKRETKRGNEGKEREKSPRVGLLHAKGQKGRDKRGQQRRGTVQVRASRKGKERVRCIEREGETVWERRRQGHSTGEWTCEGRRRRRKKGKEEERGREREIGRVYRSIAAAAVTLPPPAQRSPQPHPPPLAVPPASCFFLQCHRGRNEKGDEEEELPRRAHTRIVEEAGGTVTRMDGVKGRRKRHIIEEDEPIDKSGKYMTWEEDDNMVMSWIMNSVQPQIASTITYCRNT